MACLDRASPALKETLLKLYRAKKPMEIDQHIYEFGAVEYHVRCSASELHLVQLSIKTPLICEELSSFIGLPCDAIPIIKKTCEGAIEVVEPAKHGYQLTLKIDLSKIPRGKECMKVITEISTVQAILISYQLKEILQNANSHEKLQGLCRPIKIVYHHREPFFVIKQPPKIIAVFPMRFKEDIDVAIATTFCQELMDVGSSEAWAKAPTCTWSPIPPPELRGEFIEDLSTNCGFVSFDITSRHVKGKKLDKTVWSLLNFNAFVKYHVKCSRGFIQRRMRSRADSLVKVIHCEGQEEHEHEDEPRGCGCMSGLANASRMNTLKGRWRNLLGRKFGRMRCSIKVRGCMRLRHRLLKAPKFSSLEQYKYTKLD